MGKTTEISWCDSTFNPWIGCTKVSPACTNCYAETLTHRWGKDLWGAGQPRQRTSAANWKQPLAWEKQAIKTGVRPRVFCGSLCDWLDAEVPIEWLADLLDLIRQTPHLDWLLLTKRLELWEERIGGATGYWGYEGQIGHCGATDAWAFGFDWLHFRFPANVWIGATVENQEMADKRIPELLKIPARDRFLSCEPLLGPIDLDFFMKPLAHIPGNEFGWAKCIDWVICGGESGPKARPMHPDWPRALRDQCKADGVPFFFKQWGEWLPAKAVLSDEPYQNYFESASTGRGLMCRSTHKATQVHRFESVSGFYRNGEVAAFKVGKNAAGHLLDGVEHHEFPLLGSEASHD